MLHRLSTRRFGRRSVLKAGLALGAAPLAGPYIIKARGEEPIKIGLDDPLTGIYAALGKNEVSAASWRSSRSTPRAASSAGRSSCWSRISTTEMTGTRCRRRAS